MRYYLRNEKKLIKDKFVENLIGFKSYIAYHKISSDHLNKIKKPFFLTIKSKKRIVFTFDIKGIKIKLISKLIYFERNLKKNYLIDLKCRNAKKKDIKQIINIAKENNLNSRFLIDKLISKKFKKRYRSEWVKNFFKKKRGDYLLVVEQNKKILGFMLILKKKNHLTIDLIATRKKYRKKGVATSLINYTNNNIMGKKDKIIAGTQINNLVAVKMYKKLGFIKKKGETFCYHIHGR